MDQSVIGQLEQFFERYPRYVYQAGRSLVQPGEEPQGVYFLESGLICMQVISDTGQITTFNIFKPKTFFPMTWALNHSPNRFGLEALTRVSVRQAPAAEVIHFLKRHAEVMFDLLQRSFSGIEGLTAQLEQANSGNAKQRLQQTLYLLSRRFSQPMPGGGKGLVIGLRLTHAQLAALSGLSRETVTRELIKLRSDGMIKVLPNKNLCWLGE